MGFAKPGVEVGMGLFRRARGFFKLSEKASPIKPRTRVGVVGYSGQKFDETEARKLVNRAYDTIAAQYPDHEVTVVSGLTNLGIPKIAYEEAVKRGWRTGGVASRQAAEYECFAVDEVQIVGDHWGDESNTFVTGIDTLVRVGGGKQALAETQAVQSLGRPIVEHDLPTLPP